MLDSVHSAGGMVRIHLLSANVTQSLSIFAENGIVMHQLLYDSDLEVSFVVKRTDVRKLTKLCTKLGDICKVQGYIGLYWSCMALLKRPVLMAGLLLLLAATVWLPRHIFFVQVQGNTTIPAARIVEAASECGIGFGAPRAQVRSERVKNLLLSMVEELEWVGVNTKGCVAVISVREAENQSAKEIAAGRENLVSNRDGIVTRVVLERGDARCAVGQAVQKGQLLISAYTDCGIKILAETARGEVFARTTHETETVFPAKWKAKGNAKSVTKVYSLQIGKKRINLSFNSGILQGSCAKMTKVRTMVLPGGFSLPVALVVETYTAYEQSETIMLQQDALTSLDRISRDNLLQSMISGKVLTSTTDFCLEEDVYTFVGRYSCEEMIAVPKPAEIFEGETEDGR